MGRDPKELSNFKLLLANFFSLGSVLEDSIYRGLPESEEGRKIRKQRLKKVESYSAEIERRREAGRLPNGRLERLVLPLLYPQKPVADLGRRMMQIKRRLNGSATEGTDTKRTNDTVDSYTTENDTVDSYTADYVPAVVDRRMERLVESPVGILFRSTAPASWAVRGLLVILGLVFVSFLQEMSPSLVENIVGYGLFLASVFYPRIGPWLWGFGVFVFAGRGTGFLLVTGALFLLSLAYYAIIKGSDLDPYRGSKSRDVDNRYGDSDSRDRALADGSLDGEWKHETAEAERAHRRAQEQEPPVETGEYVSVPIRSVEHAEGQVQGEIERFRVFVDQDVPSSLQKGDVICAQIMSYATNEDGHRVGAHARFINRGTCS